MTFIKEGNPLVQALDCTVLIEFGKGIPPDIQGPAMLHLEQELREAGIPAEVFKQTKADDSRLRLSMSDNKRKTL